MITQDQMLNYLENKLKSSTIKLLFFKIKFIKIYKKINAIKKVTEEIITAKN